MKTMEDIEKKYGQPLKTILNDIYENHKTVTKVAKELGFNRKTVEKKFQKLKIPLIYKGYIVSKRNLERNYLTCIEKIYNQRIKKELTELLKKKETIKHIAKQLKLPYTTVLYTFKKYNIKNKNLNKYISKIKQKKIIINPKQLKHKAFIIGCLCGDASLDQPKNRKEDYYNLRLWSRDKDFVSFFKNSLKQFYNIKVDLKERKDTLGKRYFNISTTLKQVTQTLVKHNKYNTKSWKIPKQIINGTLPEISMFLKGLLNSDGTISKYEINFCSINLKGLKQLQKLLKKHKINSKIRVCYGYKATHKLAISHKDNLKRFINLLFDTKYLIKRKKERIEAIRRRLNEN